MKKILVVDDVKGWRDYNSNIMYELFGSDIEIKTAECASEAYNILLQEEPIDIIITDLQMENNYEPKFAGEWLVEQIKTFSRYINTKVVIVSASYNVRHIDGALGVECIPKSTALKCLSAYKEALGVV